MPEKSGEILIGDALAERVGAKLGGELRLIIPFTEESESGATSPKAVQAKVVGISHLGLYEYDSQFIYEPIADVQALMNQPGRVTTFKIKLKPEADARQASDRLADHSGILSAQRIGCR